VDAVSGAPLAGATVSIARWDGQDINASVLTEADGRFLFDNLKPGKYILSASRKGYKGQMFQEHENFTTAVAVGNDLDSQGLLFRLSPSAIIAGQVTDEFSEAVRNAGVMLFREGTINGRVSVHVHGQATTDDQGQYRFANLPPGRYYVAVSAQPWYAQHNNTTALMTPLDNGTGLVGTVGGQPIVGQNSNLDVVYPVTYYPRETDFNKASAITPRPGERATADLVLHPMPALHLRLSAPGVDLSQNVWPRVTQSTLDGQETFVSIQAISRTKDFIDVGGIPPGQVTIHLDMNPDPVGGKERRSWQYEVDLSRDGEVVFPERWEGRAAVTGTIKIAALTAVPQPAAIEIREVETGATLVSPVSAEGKFEFQDGVKPGNYTVSINNPLGFHVDHVQVIGAGASRHSIEVRSVDPMVLVVAISRGWGRIDGVALKNSKPAAGVMILCVPQNALNDASLFQRDQSDSDGTFTIAQLPPGQYSIMAIADGWDQEWARPDVVRHWLNGGEIVQVAPNEKYAIKVNTQ
jgi:protocatechuate 3,4-dioxygenase beta subunit